MTLFGSGAVLGISCPWLGKKIYNLVMAIVYTAYTKMKNTEIVKTLKTKMKFERLR